MNLRRKSITRVGVIASVAGLILGLTTVSSNALTTTSLGTPIAGTFLLSPTGTALRDDSDYLALAGTTDTTKTVATISETRLTAYIAPTVTTVNAACKKAITAAGGTAADITANCAAKITTWVSAVTQPTTTTTTASGLISTTAVSGRYCRSWKQHYTEASYHEQHIGRFCYDHRNAYVWRWGGYHYCGDNWGIGYVVDNTKCYGVRVNDSAFQGGYFRQMWDWTKMSLLFNGFPVSFTRKMHTNIFPSGRIVFHDN